MFDIFKKGIEKLENQTPFDEAVGSVSAYASYTDQKESVFAMIIKKNFTTDEDKKKFVKFADTFYKTIKLGLNIDSMRSTDYSKQFIEDSLSRIYRGDNIDSILKYAEAMYKDKVDYKCFLEHYNKESSL
ncbi:hypothetical protein HDR59_04255 [bacterium]|nr:hypothetical protein [bacterium]